MFAIHLDAAQEPGAARDPDAAFNRLALKVHAVQRATNPVLRRYWDAVSDGQPAAWNEIPPVPVRAFRDTPIVTGTAEVVFRTSGTTGGGSGGDSGGGPGDGSGGGTGNRSGGGTGDGSGGGRGNRSGGGTGDGNAGGTGHGIGRGEHHVASLELYRAAAQDNYRQHLFAGAPALSLISLVPNPAVVPDSSLATMAGFIAREPEVRHAAWAFDPERGVDVDAVREAVAAAASVAATATGPTTTEAPPRPASATPPPILLLTTAFALVQLLDALADSPLPLPNGSRIMETGGFKGRTAEIGRPTLYRRVHGTLGVPESHIVNEYGMTEMLSQAYDCVAGQGPPAAERVHRFPPWVRTRALDPADLSPLPAGRPGLLAHFDLANAASVCHLLTEDYGSVTADGGVRLLGRAPGAAVRGCSLAAEAFLRMTGAA